MPMGCAVAKCFPFGIDLAFILHWLVVYCKFGFSWIVHRLEESICTYPVSGDLNLRDIVDRAASSHGHRANTEDIRSLDTCNFWYSSVVLSDCFFSSNSRHRGMDIWLRDVGLSFPQL